MKLIHTNLGTLNYDTINYLAISQLEQIGIMEATQEQIDLMEKIIRISFNNVKLKSPPKFVKNELSGIPKLKLIQNL